ncbi:hypothetical protein K1T71_005948, partial [Dendrolimus kikuchii]
APNSHCLEALILDFAKNFRNHKGNSFGIKRGFDFMFNAAKFDSALFALQVSEQSKQGGEILAIII